MKILKLKVNHTFTLMVKKIYDEIGYSRVQIYSNLDSLLLTLALHVFILAALCQALGKVALVLQLRAALRLVFALVLCNARGANITCTASPLTDTNTVTMEPPLATNAADHEPEKSEGSTVVRK